MLPSGFQWRYIGGGLGGEPLSLFCDGCEVARLWQHGDGSWRATLGMHLPYEQRRHRVCSSKEAGHDGCEAWAIRHAEALVAHATARHEAWLAGQTWRGK